MFEERQQMMIDACNGKREGDLCKSENQRGTIQGTCTSNEDRLICTFSRENTPDNGQARK